MADDPVPPYALTADDSDLVRWVDAAAAQASALGLPLTHKPDARGSEQQARIVEAFYRLVRSRQTEAVALFVGRGLVSPDVGDAARLADSTTPLLAAVDAGDAAMVRQLAGLGADVDRLGRPPAQTVFKAHRDGLVRRTPLMLAAAQGRAALVTLLLLQELQADDSLVAPDGQLALRLAADRGHRDVVARLPARGGGGWRRVTLQNRRALRAAARQVRRVARVAVWCPAQLLVGRPVDFLVVAPLRRLWADPRGIWAALRAQTAAAARALGRVLGRLPADAWRFGCDLYEWLGALAWVCVRAVPRIPAALAIGARWLAQSAATLGRAVAHVVQRALSAVHTALAAAIGRFRSLTLADVAAGLAAAVRSVVVDLPRALRRVAVSFGLHLRAALDALFGLAGLLLYFVGCCLVWCATWIPRKLWQAVAAIGGAIGGALHELRVSINPKA